MNIYQADLDRRQLISVHLTDFADISDVRISHADWFGYDRREEPIEYVRIRLSPVCFRFFIEAENLAHACKIAEILIEVEK
jgi:hypothetical protein